MSACQVLCSDGQVYTAGQNRGGACGREKGPNPKDWAKMFTKVGPAPLPPGVTALKLVAGTHARAQQRSLAQPLHATISIHVTLTLTSMLRPVSMSQSPLVLH